MELSEFKKIIDKNISEFLNSKINIYPFNSNKEILNIFLYLNKFSKDGKRIRPYIAYLSYKASGGKNDSEAIKLFTFIELFHLYCLVHDDIMDQADKRHKIQTIHKFISSYSSEHYGNSQAILVGDLILSWSHELLLKSSFSNEIINDVRIILFKMMDEVCFGQMLDLRIKKNKKASNEEIMQKILLKTAGYSFIKPLMIGATLTGTINEDFFTKLGTSLGIAFQIQDDLLDIILGKNDKTTFNDIFENQPTLFTNYVLENGSQKQKNILRDAFGKSLTEFDKKSLRLILKESGAIEYGKNEIKLNFDNAKRIIKNSPNPKSKIFLDLINIIENRKN